MTQIVYYLNTFYHLKEKYLMMKSVLKSCDDIN